MKKLWHQGGRIRILRLLSAYGELNISEIARKTELSHALTSKHLRALERVGLVVEKRFGRIRIYRFRDEDERTKALQHLFVIWSKIARQ